MLIHFLFVSRLGEMDVLWSEDIPLSLREGLIQRLIIKIPEFQPTELSIFLKSCVLLQFHWYEHPIIREKIFRQLLRFYGKRRVDGTAREFATIFYSFGKIGLTKKKTMNEQQQPQQQQQHENQQHQFITEDIEVAFLNGIDQFANNFNQMDIAFVYHG